MSPLEGIVYDLGDADYHARPELSSTEARLLLQEGGPKRYRYRKDNPPLIDDSPKFDIGKAVHAKVLGAGADVVVVDADDWRTKAAREARQEARDAGKAPLLTREFEAVNAMAEAVLSHTTARALLSQPGHSEVSVFSEVGGVPVRARFDFLPDPSKGRTVAADVKTTIDASLREFEKTIARYQYDVQAAHYLNTYESVTDDLDAAFVFIAVEKEPPYLTAVHQLPVMWMDMGRTKARRARELYQQCTTSGVWPGYPDEVQLLTPPVWETIQFEEQYA